MASNGKHSSDEETSSSVGIRNRKSDRQTQIDFEIDFFDGILSRNPDYLDVLRVHGNNLTLVGRYADGLKIDYRLVHLRPKDALAHYNLACSLSLLNKIDPAIRALRKAIELGYRDFRYLREDRDLAAVRKDPRFRQLLREFEKKV